MHPAKLSNELHFPKYENIKVCPSPSLVEGAKVKDHSWIAHVTKVLPEDNLPQNEVITWSGYNSYLMSDKTVKPPAVIGVFPLVPDKALSPSMIKHAMQLTMQGTEYLNPGQTGVLVADQPI